ncbi:hypothetical protein EVG20_g234 [Dentipellis fragilis]|uniref:Uncharacterized protein n=1 Tax=Dentipellis fragilis TaxID=205917 RepID=A0A4Y9ZH16_9AGAM|nr:hypothetical protein EVG20_g234 [Dentipellis fragilis]
MFYSPFLPPSGILDMPLPRGDNYSSTHPVSFAPPPLPNAHTRLPHVQRVARHVARRLVVASVFPSDTERVLIRARAPSATQQRLETLMTRGEMRMAALLRINLLNASAQRQQQGRPRGQPCAPVVQLHAAGAARSPPSPHAPASGAAQLDERHLLSHSRAFSPPSCLLRVRLPAGHPCAR